jgi:hypothetical protein
MARALYDVDENAKKVVRTFQKMCGKRPGTDELVRVMEFYSSLSPRLQREVRTYSSSDRFLDLDKIYRKVLPELHPSGIAARIGKNQLSALLWSQLCKASEERKLNKHERRQ